ncbi:MAG: histidyl-tRNA synthetase, histidyl-tRNA synthetase [Candidatus Parcubacteria bacterium]
MSNANQGSNRSNLSMEPYKGVRDFYPEDQFIQDYIFNTWKKAVESFGYESYNASIIEPAELYKAKSGQEIVNEQTYTFIDRGDREITLRPEMTPTVARLVAKRKRESGYPLRLYSIPNVFRYERPQRGRLREHWQLNVDMFGVSNTFADLELVEIAAHIMKSFGATQGDYTIKVSSRKLLNALFTNWYELDQTQSHAMQKLIDRKSKISEDEFQSESEKIIGKPFTFLNFENKHAIDNPELSQALAIPTIKEAYEELRFVIESAKKQGIQNIVFDQTIIRGFDYYTGFIFEVFDNHPENNRSLFGGGRYDDLLNLFTDEKVPACGFGMGDVTIADFLATRKLLPAYSPASQIMLCIMDAQIYDKASALAQELRNQGLKIALNHSLRNIGDQIKNAEKLHIPFILIYGQDEATMNTYKIKELATGKEYTDIRDLPIYPTQIVA